MMSNEKPLTYRINVAMAKLGVSRTTIYRMVNDGKLQLIKISKRASGITADSLEAAAGKTHA
jgi:excisionase family DNA binding protein